MPARPTLETAGFVLIALSLHVAAVAAFIPDSPQKGAAADAPPAQLAAGGAEMQQMVNEWEAPPEIETRVEMPQQPQPEPAPERPEPIAEPTIEPETDMAALPQPMSEPPLVAEPNLPAPPQPAEIEAPEIDRPSDLALVRSERPDERPARPEPQRQPEPEPERRAAPQPNPAPVPRQNQQPGQAAAQRAGQGGTAPQAAQGGGGGGVSEAQRANALNRWGGQIQSCIARQARRPSGVPDTGTTLLSLDAGRDGTIRGIGIARSSGNPVLDQAAVQAAQNARRCPAAPAEVTNASYPFIFPVTLSR